MRRRALFTFVIAAALLGWMISPATLAAQQWALTRLDASPRHHEYVTLKHDGRSVRTFVVYPEVKQKAPVVVLIHEIYGLSDWAKLMADELARAGYIVVAPDLLSGTGPGGSGTSGTSAFPNVDAVVEAVSNLNPDTITADLDAAADYARTIPAGNGKIAVVGFCWGGGQSFRFATHRPDLSAAFVFYGPAPANATVSSIKMPVYGFYAGNDARITTTVPETQKNVGKRFEPVTYEGAGHGFMRAGEDPANTNPANRKARDEAFARLTRLLAAMK